jgi:hypothetical protein
MDARRKLRPHELARRDQALAEAVARVCRGEFVVWVDRCAPGTQCCWCDCPLGPDSPHNRRGYVCPYLCHAKASYVAITLGAPQPGLFPLCERHLGGYDADLKQITGDRASEVDIIGPWMDDD